MLIPFNLVVGHINGGDFEAMEELLRVKGMNLIAQNRAIYILALLKSIPEKTLFEYGWLTLYAGLMQVDFTPQATLPFSWQWQ